MEKQITLDKNFLHRFIGHHEMPKYYEIHPGLPLVDGEYDGTLQSFETVIVNLMSANRLRNYGLLHQLPFIVRNFIFMFDDEKLRSVAEVNIAHYNNKLIRMRNSSGNKEMLEVLHIDIADFFAFMHRESLQSKASKAAIVSKTLGLDAPSKSTLRLLVLSGVVTGFAWFMAMTWKRL